MKIKPRKGILNFALIHPNKFCFHRNTTGIILAIKGRKDFMILQMVDGAMTFTVNNGRGPIVAVFKPDYKFRLCDGQWHEIHAVKAKVPRLFTKC